MLGAQQEEEEEEEEEETVIVYIGLCNKFRDQSSVQGLSLQ